MTRPKTNQYVLVSRKEIDSIKKLLLSNGRHFAIAVEEVVAEMDVPKDCLLHHLIELSRAWASLGQEYAFSSPEPFCPGQLPIENCSALSILLIHPICPVFPAIYSLEYSYLISGVSMGHTRKRGRPRGEILHMRSFPLARMGTFINPEVLEEA